MTDARIELDDARVRIALERLRKFPANEARDAMAQIARYMKTAAELRFRMQIGPDGKTWTPSKAAQKRGGQTLRDTNRLFRSLTWLAGPDYAEAGTNVVYAPVHQFGINRIVSVGAHRRQTKGGDARRGTISVRSSPVRPYRRHMSLPARPFLGFSDGDANRILDILRRRIEAAAGK